MNFFIGLEVGMNLGKLIIVLYNEMTKKEN